MGTDFRHPLHDVTAEQCLIGAFLRAPSATISIARALVSAADFFDPLHQMIVELIYSFEEEGRAISAVSLNAWIKHHPGIKEIEDAPPGREGQMYLQACASAAPGDNQVDGLAAVIADFALRRQAVEAMGEAWDQIQGKGLPAPQPIMPALEGVVNVADQITEKQQARSAEVGLADHGDALIKAISHQAVAQTEFGMRTWTPLDEVLGGLYPETLLVGGGRPGMGKSVLGTNLCRLAAYQGIPADLWSIEMPGRENAARFQCDEDYDDARRRGIVGLHYEDLVKMRASTAQFERAVLANGRLRELDISVFSEDRVTMSRIAAVTRARVARKPGFRLVVIDHLHILMPEERYRGRRVDELSEITGMAKRLAKRTGACIVLLAQLSRDIEKRDDKRPYMADFRDSGSIEQDADVVMGLYRGEYYANAAIRSARNDEQRLKAISEYDACKGVLEIEVLKQRSGQTKTVKCFIDIACSAIRGQEPVAETIAQLALG